MRIAEATIDLVKALQYLLPIAYPRKRPRICKRLPVRAHGYRRARMRRRAHARAQIAISPIIACAKLQIILSQPIPKHPTGGLINDGKKETDGYGQASNYIQQ